MPDELISNIAHYGCFAIFLLVFLQEVGMPSPFPNEFILVFCGYLAFTGILNLPLVVLSVVLADLLASLILYLVFYFFGQLILQHKPKWIPISDQKIEKLTYKINHSGQSGIFIGRLTPFIKGYVTVLCGTLRISPKKFSVTLLFTSVIWTLFYVCSGFLIGPYWNKIMQSDTDYMSYFTIIVVSILLLFIAFKIVRTRLSTAKYGIDQEISMPEMQQSK
jgi:membrane protein DedA with SNARE-associated domain